MADRGSDRVDGPTLASPEEDDQEITELPGDNTVENGEDLGEENGEDPLALAPRSRVSRDYIPRASAKNTDAQTKKTMEPLLPKVDGPPEQTPSGRPSSADDRNKNGPNRYRAERQVPPDAANGTSEDRADSAESRRPNRAHQAMNSEDFPSHTHVPYRGRVDDSGGRDPKDRADSAEKDKPDRSRQWVNSHDLYSPTREAHHRTTDLDSPTRGVYRRTADDIGANDPEVDIRQGRGPPPTYRSPSGSTSTGHQEDVGMEMVTLNLASRVSPSGSRRSPSTDGARMPPPYETVVRNKYRVPSAHSTEVELASNIDLAAHMQPIRPSSAEVTQMAASLSSINRESQVDDQAGKENICHRAGGPFPAIWKWLTGACSGSVDSATRNKRRKIIVISSVVFCLLLLFLILFPVSWDQVEYYQIAFTRSRTTHKINSDNTYYPGCYVVGPDTEFVYMPGNAHAIDLSTMRVTTRDRLEVSLGVTIHYFIRPEEAGLLFEMYEFEYEHVLNKIAISTIKNTIIQFSLDDMRLNRTGVEDTLHRAVYNKLSGDCCPVCCPTFCGDLCSRCKIDVLCSPGSHVNVKYFWLGGLSFSSSIEERLMKRLLLVEEAEAEKFKQEYAVTEKETDLKVQAIQNEANEVLQFAQARSAKMNHAAVASADQITQNATIIGWQKTCDRLGLTVEDHKMSMLYIRSLDAMDNLYRSEDFDVNNMWHFPQAP